MEDEHSFARSFMSDKRKRNIGQLEDKSYMDSKQTPYSCRLVDQIDVHRGGRDAGWMID